MSLKYVAVDGMTQLNTASGWTNTVFNVTKGTTLKVEGKIVELSANAVWTHPSLGTDTASLTPSGSVIKDNGSSVLRLGDIGNGVYNSIEVKDGQTILKSE